MSSQKYHSIHATGGNLDDPSPECVAMSPRSLALTFPPLPPMCRLAEPLVAGSPSLKQVAAMVTALSPLTLEARLLPTSKPTTLGTRARARGLRLQEWMPRMERPR